MKALLRSILFLSLSVSSFAQGSAIPENSEWDAYLRSINFSEIQKGCEPQRFAPPIDVPIKSKILLIHGFTACPQQFFEMANILSRRGVLVYLFLLPGHGKLVKSDGHDNLEGFPTHDDRLMFQQLAETFNKVAMSDNLPTTLGGMSVGGAVALRAAKLATYSYEKLLLFSPFFGPGSVSKDIDPIGYYQRLIFPVVAGVPFIRDSVQSWGPSCLHERALGRAGGCEFTISNLFTAIEFGQDVMSSAGNVSPKTQIQILGAEGETNANNKLTAKVFSQLLDRNDGKVEPLSACFYPKGSNHSLVSRFDAPEENKFWLSSLLEDVSSFVSHEPGIPVPVSEDSLIEEGFKLCEVRK